jgi:tetratricopeptide (TPR) repeat protein
LSTTQLLAQAAREHQAGRLIEAELIYRRVLSSEPEQPDALSNLGLLLGQTRKFGEAEQVLQRLVARAPGYAGGHVNLALILHQQQKFAEAIASCERAMDTVSDTRARQKLQNTLALSLTELGRYDEALALLGRMTAAHPGFAGGHHMMGRVHAKKGAHNAAVHAFDRAAQLDTRDLESVVSAGECLMLQGRAADALQRLDRALAARPYDVRALALRTLALAELGRKEDEAWQSDPNRLVKTHRLAEKGYGAGQVAALNRGLSRFASSEPSLRQDPPEYATRKAWHSTTNLAQASDAALEELKAFIAFAFEQRVAGLKQEDPRHPFVRGVPPRCHLDLWAIKMKDGGNLFPHIHVDGWLSGVYYVDVPAIVDDPSAGQAGWLKIGTSRMDIKLTRDPLTLAVKPEPGMMVTFPSYLWHDTVPLPEHNTEQRLCLAFDLCPMPK